MLYIEVLDIWKAIGIAPGDVRIMPGNDAGDAREGDPRQLKITSAEMVLIPYRRDGQAEVHVVRQERDSRGRVSPRNRERIRARAGLG